MKRIDTLSITDSARMPFAAKSLSFLQDSYKEVVDALVRGLINYTNGTVLVLYGCEVTGSSPNFSVSSGAIYYNDGTLPVGEIYLVSEGTVTTTGSNIPVWTKQTLNNAQYNNGAGLVNLDPVTFTDNNPYFVHDVNEFVLVSGPSGGSGVTGYVADYNGSNVNYNFIPGQLTNLQSEITTLNSDITTINSEIAAINSVPSGIIVMWSGSSIPGGWNLCDGTNGTPNLSGRFIVGKGTYTDSSGTYTYNVGDTGGEAKHLLLSSESGLPDHTHNSNNAVNTNSSPGNNIDFSGGGGSGETFDSTEVTGTVSGGAQNASAYHENRPPYYALAYIMKS